MLLQNLLHSISLGLHPVLEISTFGLLVYFSSRANTMMNLSWEINRCELMLTNLITSSVWFCCSLRVILTAQFILHNNILKNWPFVITKKEMITIGKKLPMSLEWIYIMYSTFMVATRYKIFNQRNNKYFWSNLLISGNVLLTLPLMSRESF